MHADGVGELTKGGGAADWQDEAADQNVRKQQVAVERGGDVTRGVKWVACKGVETR